MWTASAQKLLETGGAVAAFMAVFLVGGHIRPGRLFTSNERNLLSLSAGVSVAYVFVHLMPELAGARQTFVKWTPLPKVFDGMAVYFFALLGFLAFYSLDHFSKQARLAAVAAGRPISDFEIRVIGFAGYVCLVSYLLVNNLENSPLASGAYSLAMAVHFLTFDHGFREESDGGYQRRGHFLLAAAAPIGWGLGLAFALPSGAVALMLGFLSGGVIVNSMIAELPNDKDGRLWPFVTGSLLYAAILIPLG